VGTPKQWNIRRDEVSIGESFKVCGERGSVILAANWPSRYVALGSSSVRRLEIDWLLHGHPPRVFEPAYLCNCTPRESRDCNEGKCNPKTSIRFAAKLLIRIIPWEQAEI